MKALAIIILISWIIVSFFLFRSKKNKLIKKEEFTPETMVEHNFITTTVISTLPTFEEIPDMDNIADEFEIELSDEEKTIREELQKDMDQYRQTDDSEIEKDTGLFLEDIELSRHSHEFKTTKEKEQLISLAKKIEGSAFEKTMLLANPELAKISQALENVQNKLNTMPAPQISMTFEI